MESPWLAVASWLLHVGLGGGAVLALSALALGRVKQPARRQRLGEAGVLAALALAALAWGPNWIAIPIGQAALPAVEMLSMGSEPATDRGGAAAAMAAPPHAPAPTGAAQLGAVANPTFGWMHALAGAWAGGALLFAVRWAIGFVALRRLIGSSRPASAELLTELASACPTRGVPRLLIASRLRAPISCGILRPTIILPERLTTPDKRQQRCWVFAHELTHLDRYDAWSGLLFALGQIVFYPLPWFWRLRRQVQLCQEYVADAAAAPAEQAAEYAAFLVSLTGTPPAPQVATGVVGAPSDLYRRVTMMLENPMPVEKRCPMWWTAGAAGALIGLAVFGAGVSLAQAPPSQREVVEQLERIQDLVHQLRHQLAEQPKKAEEPQPARHIEKTVDWLRRTQTAQPLPQTEAIDKLVAPRLAAQLAVKEDRRPELIRRIFLDIRGTPPTVDELRKYMDVPPQDIVNYLIQRPGAAAPMQGFLPLNPDAQLQHALELLEQYRRQLDQHPPKSAEEVQKRLQEIIDRLNSALRNVVRPRVTPVEAHLRPHSITFTAAGPESPHGRLGIRVEAPSAPLREQLQLPAEEGLVVTEVFDKSVAKEAGIQVNDILLRVGTQPVPSHPDGLVKLLAGIEAERTFDIEAMRRGKAHTIAAVKLRPPAARVWAFAEAPAPVVTLSRQGDRAIVRSSIGPTSYHVEGRIKDGKPELELIRIVEGEQANDFKTLAAVPKQHRGRIEQLIQIMNALDYRGLPASSTVPLNFDIIRNEADVDPQSVIPKGNSFEGKPAIAPTQK